MKRRSFIASLFAASAAPVVAKAIPARTLLGRPVVEVPAPEIMPAADMPIVVDGDVELSESDHVKFVETPCDVGNFRQCQAVARVKKYKISCYYVSDARKLFDALYESRKITLTNGATGVESTWQITGWVKDVKLKFEPDEQDRFVLTVEANASPTTEAMR